MTDNNDDDDKTYSVGYGKPPEHSRFKPGISGNKNGPGKRVARSIARGIGDELKEMVVVQEGGKKKKMTKGDLVARQIVDLAAKGDKQTIKLLCSLLNVSEMVKREQIEQPLQMQTSFKEQLARKLERLIAAAKEQAREAETKNENGSMQHPTDPAVKKKASGSD